MTRSETIPAALILLLSLVLCTSCEKPRGDFVIGRYTNWFDVFVLTMDADTGPDNIADIREWLSRDPSTIAATALAEIPSKAEATATLYIAGREAGTGVPVHLQTVDPGFLATFDLQLLAGRFFVEGSQFDKQAIVVNETAAALLSGNDRSGIQQANYFDIIGKRVAIEFEAQKLVAEVIGVIEDYRFRPGITIESVPLAFRMSPEEYKLIAVRSADTAVTPAVLREQWYAFFNEDPPRISKLSDMVTDLDMIRIRNESIKQRIALLLTYVIHGVFFLFIVISLVGNALGRGWTITKDLFHFKGRVARGVLSAITLMTAAVAFVFFFLLEETSFAWYYYIPEVLVYALAGLVQTFNIIKRFHDLGRPGTDFWLLFVPVYNLYISWVLFTRKGTEAGNEYGMSPLAAT